MKRYGRVGLVYGGSSSEREVSLESGRNVLAALQSSGVQVEAFDGIPALLAAVDAGRIDRVFIILHGGHGEDGSLQGALDIRGVPYTGSGVLGSALAMDKIRSKWIWQRLEIPTADFAVVEGDTSANELAALLELPLVVKPAAEGSTVGISLARDLATLESGLSLARQHAQAVLAERLIDGPEFTVGILGEQALPVIRIVPAGGFYDYQAKYVSDDTQYLIPCGLAPDDEALLQEIALEAFDAVGCHGWGRVDLMIDADGQPYVLEVNTAPGMTSHSLVPKAAAAMGLDFAALCLAILDTSLEASA
ncbi:MAG: D-alanine--D-alanine ligase [Xanthomonadales bacterium]|nr:D-alanine--D-alanine ligase [Xanthomonadales bacterium]